MALSVAFDSWHSRIRDLLSLGVTEVLACKLRGASQLFFDTQQLVVLGQTFTTTRGTSLDLKYLHNNYVYNYNYLCIKNDI